MKKIYLLLIIGLLLFPPFAFAGELGQVKIMIPMPGCTVRIDGVSFEAGSNEFISINVEPGRHQIKVIYDKQGNVLFDGAVKVDAAYATIVRPELPDHLTGEVDPARASQYLRDKYDAELNDTDHSPAQMGIRIGLDDSSPGAIVDYVLYYDSISPVWFSYRSHYTSYLDLSLSYRWKLMNRWYADVELGLMSAMNLVEDTNYPIPQSIYFGAGLGYKLGKPVMIGFRPVISMWNDSGFGKTTAAGIGYQLFMEIIPISTEFGFVSRYIINTKRSFDMNPPHMTLDGYYIKYRIDL